MVQTGILVHNTYFSGTFFMNIDPFFTIETWKQKIKYSLFLTFLLHFLMKKEEDATLYQKLEVDNEVI